MNEEWTTSWYSNCFIAETGHKQELDAPTVMVWPTRKGSVFETLIATVMNPRPWPTPGVNQTLFKVRLTSGSNLVLHVSSPRRRNPKKAMKGHGGPNHEGLISLVDGIASSMWKSRNWWIVIGSRTQGCSPCDRWIPRVNDSRSRKCFYSPPSHPPPPHMKNPTKQDRVDGNRASKCYSSLEMLN